MVVGNINGMMELAHDSVNLLREIIGEAKSFGENELKSIKISDSGREIIIEDSNNSTLEYSLSEVSCILTDSIAGLWKFGESFEESINIIYKRTNDNYAKLEKGEFIEYAGRAAYTKCRLDQILNVLRGIEKDV